MIPAYFPILWVFASLLFSACANSDSLSEENLPEVFLTHIDAEKILGETAHLSDSSLAMEKGVVQYKLTYTADSAEVGTGKIGNVYFMMEIYDDAASAHKTYTSFLKSNEDHEGVEILENMGDEAYFHADANPRNFVFIIVRKDEKMFRIKINKVTEKTSIESLNEVATLLTSQL